MQEDFSQLLVEIFFDVRGGVNSLLNSIGFSGRLEAVVRQPDFCPIIVLMFRRHKMSDRRRMLPRSCIGTVHR
jgi:hypothetical protein